MTNKFFHKIGKKSETKKFTVQKKNSPFKSQVIYMIFKFKTHHRERRSVSTVKLVFYVFKGKQLK